jgi:drug/metabolite transporter (DMT)-like permease
VTPRQALMLVTLAAAWGASFLFIAIAVEDLGAIGVAEGRVVLAVAGLVAYAAAVRRLPALRARWRGYLVLGTINAALPFALISAAEETIPASLAAIVNATAPLFSAVGAALWLSQPMGRRGAAGLGLGVAGVALVVGLAPVHLTTETVLAIAACLAAAAAYAVGGHLVKLRFTGESPLALAIGQQLGAMLVLAPFLAALPPRQAPSAGALWAMLGLGLVCTAFAYILYFRLIAELGATSALTVTYLVPVFGVLWAALFRGEHITGGMVAGAAVVLGGVLLVAGASPPMLRRSG